MKLEVIINDSINVSGKKLIDCRKNGRESKTIDMSKTACKYNEKYSVHNNVICFVHKKQVFVTPFTRQRLAVLDNAGFRPDNFHVPFSNGDFPIKERTRWEKLIMEARGTDGQYEKKCIRWADKNNIRPLKKETLRFCFRIPFSGVPVKYSDRYESRKARIYPACKECAFDASVIDKLGTYCRNNGKIAFVYRDGHTYVTRRLWVLNELHKSGYKEGRIFVPFSRGEVITDPVIKKKWEET